MFALGIFMIRRDVACIVIVFTALAITAVVYWPALTGPFLFDDLRNLVDLGRASGVTDWPSLALWLFGGLSGPLGRPISLASFLLNDYTWPSQPWSFKYTNLLLHLLAGLLVFWLLDEVGKTFADDERRKRARLAAAIAVAAWLIHPIHMATTMFVVQRMTILATIFMLGGMIVWLKGRALAASHPARASAMMLGGLGCFGLLAILSKETGALITCYVAVLAFTLAPVDFRSRVIARLHWSVLLTPVAAAVAYVCWTYPEIVGSFSIRDFTPFQRLLTEPLVLWDYVRELVVPDLRISLYFDDLVAARALFDPPAAGWALLAWSALLGLAIFWRKRSPVVSFSILWFIVGHSLEAGPFSLELAFLHRNYLPVVGPLFGAAYALCGLPSKSLAVLLAAVLFAAFGSITAINAVTWGNEGLLINTWAQLHPHSPRALQSAASFWLRHGNLDRSLSYLNQAIEAEPANPALRIQRVYLRCLNQLPQAESWDALLQMLPSADIDTSTSESFVQLQNEIERSPCPGITAADVRRAETVLITHNPRYAGSPSWRRALEMNIGISFAKERNLAEAIKHLDAADAAQRQADVPQIEAGLMELMGRYPEALRYLQRARETPPRNFGERVYFEERLRPMLDRRIESLEKKLAARPN